MSKMRVSCAAPLGLSMIMSAAVLAAQPISQPLRLSDALSQAEELSPEIRAAAASVEAAEARARQAGFRPNPEAHVTLEAFGGTGPYSGLQSAETTVSVAQQFELGGKREARRRAALADIDVANLQLAVARADLRRDVETAFAEVLAGQQRIQLTEQSVARAEDLARVAKALVDAGREPPLRQLRAETALNEARAALAEATANELAARLMLAERFGAADPISAIGSDMRPETLPPAFPANERLDVRLAEARLAAARAAVDRERTLGVPSVTAEAGVRHYSDTGDQALVAGFSLPLPIRDRNQGSTAAAAAEARAAEIRRDQALATASRSDREAVAALAAANAQLSALSGSTIPQAEEALRLARLGYQAGKFGLIDVLDAQTALNEAQSRLVDARLSRERARARLERVRAQGDRR